MNLLDFCNRVEGILHPEVARALAADARIRRRRLRLPVPAIRAGYRHLVRLHQLFRRRSAAAEFGRLDRLGRLGSSPAPRPAAPRSEEHTSELQSLTKLL